MIRNLSDEEATIIIPRLSPQHRALYDRMAEVEIDLNMSVTPLGVIACREHREKKC